MTNFKSKYIIYIERDSLMLEKIKFIGFILCNILVGCIAGWLFIYATPMSCFVLITAHILAMLLLEDKFKSQ